MQTLRNNEYFSNPVFEKMLDCLIGHPIAFFVGSGISVDPPSNLPTGDELKNAIFESIFHGEFFPGYVQDSVKKIVGGYRPETFLFLINDWGDYNWKKIIPPLLHSQSNSNHHNISSLVEGQKTHIILTTNFDCLLEQSLKQRNIGFDLYVFSDDYKKFDLHSGNSIIKLHGTLKDCTNKDLSDSIIGSMTEVANRQVPSLTQIQESTLKSILENFIVVFLGYSGSDEYDILPVISNTDCKKIVWISHENKFVSPKIEWSADIRKRTPQDFVDILISKQSDSARIFCHTSSFLWYLTRASGATPFEPTDSGSEKIQREIGSVHSRKNPLGLLGQLLHYGHEYPSAKWAYSAAIEKGDTADDELLGDLYRGMGISCIYLNEHIEAIDALMSAKKLYESQYILSLKDDDEDDSSHSFIHQRHFLVMSQLSEDIGLAYYHIRDFEKALNHLTVAKKWSERLVIPSKSRFLGRNNSNLALVYFDKCMKTEDENDQMILLQQSFSCFNMAVILQENAGDVVGLAKTLNCWALRTMVTQDWKAVLNQSYRSYCLMKELKSPFSSEEFFQARCLILYSLCALAENGEEAERILKDIQPDTCIPVQEIFSLYISALEKHLIFKSKPPEEHPKYLDQIRELVIANHTEE